MAVGGLLVELGLLLLDGVQGVIVVGLLLSVSVGFVRIQCLPLTTMLACWRVRLASVSLLELGAGILETRKITD
jgi:hypothetical protein